MSITCVNEKAEQRNARIAAETREYRRLYQVETTGSDSEFDVIYAEGLPDVGDTHPDDLGAVVIDKSAQPVGDNRTTWHVSILYQNQNRTIRIAPQEDPLDRDPVIRWDNYTLRKVVEKDLDDNPIASSAGDFYEPFTELEEYFPMVTIERIELNYDPVKVNRHMNTLNSSATTIAGIKVAAKQALLKSYDGANVFIDGDQYWRVIYQVMFAPTWDLILIDRGLYYLDGETKKRITIDGKDAVKAQNLNGSGGLSTGSIYEQTFRLYETTDFSKLDLNI